MKRSILQSTTRIRPELARGVVACALIALAVTPPANGERSRLAGASAASAWRAELGYTVQFGGVGADGVDNIWRGPLGGTMPGEITLRVEYRGAPMDVARPVWPVRVMAFVAADDPTKSFVAESDGTLDWNSGTMRLTGHVSEGWMNGASVEQSLRLDRTQLDGTGTLQLYLATADATAPHPRTADQSVMRFTW